jgi:hypothetical protein
LPDDEPDKQQNERHDQPDAENDPLPRLAKYDLTLPDLFRRIRFLRYIRLIFVAELYHLACSQLVVGAATLQPTSVA